MSDQPDYALAPFFKPAHNRPAGSQSIRGMSQDQLESLRDNLVESIIQVIVQALTGFLSPESAVKQLRTWGETLQEQFEDIPGLGDIIEILTGREDGDLNDLATWVRNLSRLLANPAGLADTAFDVANGLRRILLSLGPIPAGSISGEQPNLHPVQGFPEGSIAEGSEWVVDMSTTHTADGTGAAQLTLDGRYHALRTGLDPTDKIPVATGQYITETIWVRHEGYSGVGDAPILLQVVPFQGDTQLAPVTLATYTPEAADADWYELTNAEPWEVPAGVTSYQARIFITDGALEGTLWFDDDYGSFAATLPPERVTGLPDALESLLGFIQSVINTIANTLSGAQRAVSTIEELVESLLNILPRNIGGVGGPADLVESLVTLLASIVGGVLGTPLTSVSNAQAFNIFQMFGSDSALGRFAWQVLGIRKNTHADGGLLPTGQPNIKYASINTTVEATPTASLISTYRVPVSQAAGVLSWRGYRAGGMSALYVVIRKIDPVTGARVPVHTSGNLIGITVTDEPGWAFYEFTPLATVATEEYEVEWIPVGGSYFMRGIDFADGIDDHPFAAIKSLGATRDSSADPTNPGTVAKNDVTPSSMIPWFEMAIELGTEGDVHADQVVALDTPGDYLIPRPVWASEIDIVIAPAAGGGSTGGFGAYGRPGGVAPWVTFTATLGTDFDDEFEEVPVHLAAGGGGGGLGPAFDDGSPGGTTTVELPLETISAPGGDGGSGSQIFRPTAPGRGTLNYNDRTFTAGGAQSALGGDGVTPGGAGNGGSNFVVQTGGDGGDAGVWLVFRQTDTDTEETTAPEAPTLSFVASTSSSITVEAT